MTTQTWIDSYAVERAVRVEPGKAYTLSLSAWNINWGELYVTTVPGYRVRMDGFLRTRTTFGGSANILFEVQPLNAGHPELAGLVSPLPTNSIDFRVSLGSLLNGASAGELALVDSGAMNAADWPRLFTPGMLFYETASWEEVFVFRNWYGIHQIAANQVVVDVELINWPNAYKIRCYHPNQRQGTDYPWTFTGSSFLTYEITQGSTATSLRIKKEIRDITSLTEPCETQPRTEYFHLKREGSWPAFKWTRTDWCLSADPANAFSETYVDGTGPGTKYRQGETITTSRTETISVRVPGSTTPVTSIVRDYRVPLENQQSTIGETLDTETVGSTSSNLTTAEYYTNLAEPGSLGHVKSARMPGGNWVVYEYYPSDLSTGYQGGRVKYCYRPYVNLPSAPPSSPAFIYGDVTYYEYVNDPWGAPTRPSLVLNMINGTWMGRTTTTYNDNLGMLLNGYPISRATTTEYANGSLSQQTIVNSYALNASSPFIRGQVYSVYRPNDVKEAYLYQKGHWDGTSFQLYGTVNASRISVINGTVSGGGISTVEGQQSDMPGYVTFKTTRKVTIRDSRALVVRTEEYVFWNNAWHSIKGTTYSYDFAGRLISRLTDNGDLYTATYTNGVKSSETDELGITTTFVYDAHGRLERSTRSSQGAIGELVTQYTYDAAGRVTKEEVGFGQANPITTQRAYDSAGRVITETPPGSYGVVSHSYNPDSRTHTVTKADGATITTTNYRDGRLYSVTGNGTVSEHHTYTVETISGVGGYFGAHKVNYDGETSARWVKTWQDQRGREWRTERPGFTGQSNVVTTNTYASTGLLIKSTKTGYAPTLYTYDNMGQPWYTCLDVDNSGTIVLASSDRITDTSTYYENYGGNWWLRKDTRTWAMPGSSVTSTSRIRLTGTGHQTETVDADGNITQETRSVERSNRIQTITTTRTGVSSSRIESVLNGFSVSVQDFDGLTVTKGYDSYLRPSTVTDSRNKTTTTAYLAGTSLISTVTDSNNGQSVTTYDTSGRVSTQRDARSHYTRFSYNLRGQVTRQWGDATTPVEYGYASNGDRTSMSTFRGGSGWDETSWPTNTGTADTVTWTYDGPSGLLTAKTYPAANSTVTMTYDLRRQIATLTRARGVVITYGYDSATGELLSKTYSDSTPSVSYTYTRLGQLDSVTDTTGSRDFVYDPNYHWRLYAEAFDTFYGQRVLTRQYETSGMPGRPRGFNLGSDVGSNSELEHTYGFATASGRLTSVFSGYNGNSATRTFSYGYQTNFPSIASLATDNNSFNVQWDLDANRNILKLVSSKWQNTVRTLYETQAFDALSHRTAVEQSGSAFSGKYDTSVIHQDFAYNSRNELTAAPTKKGSHSDSNEGEALSDRQHEFNYDFIGNRVWTGLTGNANDHKAYTSNALNQYTVRQTDGANESFSYDADGNLLQDALWSYTWDAENRLVRMTSRLPVGSEPPRLELNFKYDYLNRRVEKRVECLDRPTPNYAFRYLYDGWNLVAEYGYASSELGLVRSYTWGLDLAGSLTAAGGVGALLQVVSHSTTENLVWHPTYDCNGNIAALVNASSGEVDAVFEYSPFGQRIYATFNNNATKEQPFRFSTKFTDTETDLIYYGRRYYSPSQGRFLGRDPVQEKGGLNLYGFVGNNGVNRWDYLGMWDVEGMQAELEQYRDELKRIEDDASTYGREGDYQSKIDALNEKIARLETQLAQIASKSVAEQDRDMLGDMGLGGPTDPRILRNRRILGHVPVVGSLINAILAASRDDVSAATMHTILAGLETTGPGDALKAGRVLVAGVVVTLRTGAAAVARAYASRELRRQMINAGIKEIDGYAAHHIVPFGAAGTQEARDILIKYGVDINSATNGAFISSSLNAGLHNNPAYIQAVNSALRQAKSQEEVLVALRGIQQDILEGVFSGLPTP